MKFREQQIVDYYDTCEFDYRIGWNLGRSVAMHFGYWDESTRTHAQALERENGILATCAGIGPNDRVLDAGCGMGGSAIYLANRLGCRVTGITLSQRQVAYATRQAHLKGVGHLTTFQKMDYLSTTFPDNSFEVVWAIESVCHARDKAAFVKEMHRVLRKGGRLVVADGFAARNNYNQTQEALMARWLHGWHVDSLETIQDFMKFLQEAGFRDVWVTDVTKHILPSSRRLYFLGRSMSWFTALAGYMGRAMRTRAWNWSAAKYQYLALKLGLWTYAIVSARKE